MIKCPNCNAEFIFFEGFPEGTYTEICPHCLETFSYIIENGELRPWEPTKIAGQSWKGAGEPGGK